MAGNTLPCPLFTLTGTAIDQPPPEDPPEDPDDTPLDITVGSFTRLPSNQARTISPQSLTILKLDTKMKV